MSGLEAELVSIIQSVHGQFRGGVGGETEQQASQRFFRLCGQAGAWHLFLQALYSNPGCGDDVFFFVCLGLHRVVWSQWPSLRPDEQSAFAAQVVALVSERGAQLQPYARKKLEQVLAGICANAGDFSPVTGLLVAASDGTDAASLQRAVVGLSSLQAALEEALSPQEARLVPGQKEAVVKAASAMVLPATNHACSMLALALSTLTSAPPAAGSAPEAALRCIVQVSLSVLRVIVAQVPVGPHLSLDVLQLLFSAAELGTGSQGAGTASSEYLNLCAVGAVEVLSELMAKRYLPPRSAASDSSADALLMLVGRALGLMQGFSGRPDLLSASPVTLPLLEFLVCFTENHLARCLSSAPSSVSALVQELARLACACADAEVLVKVIEVWEAVLLLSDEARAHVLHGQGIPDSDPASVLSLAQHILRCSLLQRNTDLADAWGADISEEASLDALTDPHVREVVALCLSPDGSGGAAAGAEEAPSHGTALHQGCLRLLASLSEAPAVSEMLSASIPALINEGMTALSSSSPSPTPGAGAGAGGGELTARAAAALDLSLLVRLLPLCVPPMQLYGQLVGLLSQLAQGVAGPEPFCRGRDFAALLVAVSQVLGQLLQVMSGAGPRGVEAQAACESVATLSAASSSLCSATAFVTQNPGSMPPIHPCCVSALLAVLLQSVTVSRDLLRDASNLDYCRSVLQPLVVFVEMPRIETGLQPEAGALLSCCCDILSGGELADRFSRMSLDCSQTEGWRDPVQLEHVTRLCLCLDAVVRHHAIAKAIHRQLLTSALEPLKTALPALCHELLQALLLSSSSSQSHAEGLLRGVEVILALSCSLLRCLGKASFGSAAAAVASVAVGFISAPDPLAQQGQLVQADVAGVNGATRLLSGGSLVAIEVLRRLLLLLQARAETTTASSASVPQQVQQVGAALGAIVPTLSNPRVCGELLRDCLRCGSVAVLSYWSSGRTTQAGTSTPTSGQGAAPMVEEVVVVLTTLVQGSLSSEASPEDALVAVEGVQSLGGGLGGGAGIFSQSFFLRRSLAPLCMAVIRCLVRRWHCLHAEPLERLLESMLNAAAPLAIVAAITDAHAGASVAPIASDLSSGPYALACKMVLAAAEEAGVQASQFSDLVQEVTVAVDAAATSSPVLGGVGMGANLGSSGGGAWRALGTLIARAAAEVSKLTST